MQAAIERAHRRRDAAVAGGQRRSDDARGKGRGVESVLGVEKEALVHDLALQRVRLLAAQHVEEIRTVGQVVSRGDIVLALLRARRVRARKVRARIGSDDAGDL
jgi:hypothetical protein